MKNVGILLALAVHFNWTLQELVSSKDKQRLDFVGPNCTFQVDFATA